MPIEDRNLPAGAILTARFKGEDHTVIVLEHEGRRAFELDSGMIYKSLSAAGSAVMGGTACNGWRFWSREGEEPAPRERKAKEPKIPRERKPARPRASRPRSSGEDYREWSDERLEARIESIEADLPALDGEVLEQSQAMLDRAKAELARRRESSEA